MPQYSIDHSSEPVDQFVRNQVRDGSPLELLDGGKMVAVLVSAEDYMRHYTPKKDFRQSLLEIRQRYGLDDPNFDDNEMSDAEFETFWDNLRDRSPGREVEIW
ncbi:MAG: hypothetical protein WBC73_08950 [Phormidesmis sp.]